MPASLTAEHAPCPRAPGSGGRTNTGRGSETGFQRAAWPRSRPVPGDGSGEGAYHTLLLSPSSWAAAHIPAPHRASEKEPLPAPVCASVFLLAIVSCMHIFFGASVGAAPCRERFCHESRDLRRGIEPPKSFAHLSSGSHYEDNAGSWCPVPCSRP